MIVVTGKSVNYHPPWRVVCATCYLSNEVGRSEDVLAYVYSYRRKTKPMSLADTLLHHAASDSPNRGEIEDVCFFWLFTLMCGWQWSSTAPFRLSRIDSGRAPFGCHNEFQNQQFWTGRGFPVPLCICFTQSNIVLGRRVSTCTTAVRD